MSSGSIKDLERAHARQMDGLRQKNERELKFIQSNHEDMRAEQRKSNDADLVSLQESNARSLASANARKEKVLEGMRSHLQETKNITDKELDQLEANAAKKRVAIDTRFAQERERLENDNELYLEDMNHRFNLQGQKILHDGRNRVSQLETSQIDEYNQKRDGFQRKSQEQRQEFATRYNHDEQVYKKEKDDQDRIFKKERMNQNLRQHHELEKMGKAHDHTKKFREVEFKRDVGAQEDFFEKRYTSVRNKHEADFQRLNELNEKIVNQNKANLAKEITLHNTRAQDPFFEFVELKPTIKELPDAVEVSVKVPEDSKSDMLLSINNKTVILNFNRRYKDHHQDASGGESRINKVESLSSKVVTNHHLDAKDVKSRYEGGMMIFTIKKA